MHATNDKLFICPLCYNSSLLKLNYRVAVADRGETVRDHQNGQVSPKTLNRLNNRGFRRNV